MFNGSFFISVSMSNVFVLITDLLSLQNESILVVLMFKYCCDCYDEFETDGQVGHNC